LSRNGLKEGVQSWTEFKSTVAIANKKNSCRKWSTFLGIEQICRFLELLLSRKYEGLYDLACRQTWDED
jgi:hypothetical protein